MAVPKKIINPGEQTKALCGARDGPPGDAHTGPLFSLASKAHCKAQLLTAQNQLVPILNIKPLSISLALLQSIPTERWQFECPGWCLAAG